MIVELTPPEDPRDLPAFRKALLEAIKTAGNAATLADAIVEMSRKGMGMTAVVDADGRIAGIFTDGDLRRCLDRVRDVAAVNVGDVMTRHPRTVRPEQLAVDDVSLVAPEPAMSPARR